MDVRVGVGGREHRMHPMPGGRRRDQPGAEGAADRDVERRRAHTHAPRELSVVVGGAGAILSIASISALPLATVRARMGGTGLARCKWSTANIKAGSRTWPLNIKAGTRI